MDDLIQKLQATVDSEFTSLQQVDQAQEDVVKIQSTYKIICSVLKNKKTTTTQSKQETGTTSTNAELF
jgi:hypothetical protein